MAPVWRVDADSHRIASWKAFPQRFVMGLFSMIAGIRRGHSIRRHTLGVLIIGGGFTAQQVGGPWTVATSVPPAIYSIPPESPLYFVTFVRIYGVTEGVVEVGYTPGYQSTVIDPATGVVVYGIGYAYESWLGTEWYGVPVTYGYGAAVAYTPWTGWAVAFGLGWAWGGATTAAGWGWGPYP